MCAGLYVPIFHNSNTGSTEPEHLGQKSIFLELSSKSPNPAQLLA